MEITNVTMHIDDVYFEDNISDALTEKISSDIFDDLIDKVCDEAKKHVESEVNFDEILENWFRYNFNAEDYGIQTEIDMDSEISRLLDGYNPANPCSTGELFRSAIKDTIFFFNVENSINKMPTEQIQEMVNTAVKDQVAKLVGDEIRKQVIAILDMYNPTNLIKTEVFNKISKAFS